MERLVNYKIKNRMDKIGPKELDLCEKTSFDFRNRIYNEIYNRIYFELKSIMIGVQKGIKNEIG